MLHVSGTAADRAAILHKLKHFSLSASAQQPRINSLQTNLQKNKTLANLGKKGG
jgi:hypothetical protein